MLEKATQSVEDGLSSWCGNQASCSYGFKKTSMSSHEDATACYVLQMPKIRHTATIAAFLLGFCSKNQAPPAKNDSATATITIKPERLAHLCVEQALLYPWMCFTSWFELHRSQDGRFSAPSSVNFTWGHWPFCCVRQGCVRYDSCCTLNLLIKQTIHYIDKIIQVFKVSSLSCNQ